MSTPLHLAGDVESQIKAYAQDRSEAAFLRVWNRLARFWLAVGHAPFEAASAGDAVPDPYSAHYRLCYRLLLQFEHEGFDAASPSGDRILNAAAEALVDYLNRCHQDGDYTRDLFPQGEDGAVVGHGYVAVDLVKVKVIRSYAPIVAGWSLPIRRSGLKVGRNDPCPCGARVANKPVKHKRCCGRGTNAAVT